MISKDVRNTDPAVAFPLPMFLPSLRTGRAAANFFDDTPWLNVPAHRLGQISELHIAPRGYLLGGSSKPSKLAALAAARKKKQEEAKAGTPASSGDAEQTPDKAVALLDRLKENPAALPKEASPGPSVLRDKTNVEEETKKQNQPRSYPIRRKKSPSPVREEPVIEEPQPEPKEEPTVKLVDLLGTPSTFARTVIGSAPGGQLRNGGLFSLPYTSDPEYAKVNPFAGPSPDDVVLNAQAKGAIRA